MLCSLGLWAAKRQRDAEYEAYLASDQADPPVVVERLLVVLCLRLSYASGLPPSEDMMIPNSHVGKGEAVVRRSR